jgi:hypothetical protein
MSEQIIVLSPRPATEAGSFYEVYDGAYLGGQTRMLAAVALAKLQPDLQLVMVGGCNLQLPYASDKVDAMLAFMQESSELDTANRLTGQPSLPCTYHNAVAAFLRMQREGQVQNENNITFLTSGYHRERTLAQALLAWEAVAPTGSQAHITVLSAETVLGISEATLEARYDAAYAKRLSMEAQGLHDIHAGVYTDSCVAKHAAELQPILAAYGDELLSTAEQRDFALLR